MRSSIVYWNNSRIDASLRNHPITPGKRFQTVPVTYDQTVCNAICIPPACSTHDGTRCLCGANHAPRDTVWQHNHDVLAYRELANIPVPARRAVKVTGKGRAPITARSRIGEDANQASSIHAAITLEPLGKQIARQHAYDRAVIKFHNDHGTTLAAAATIIARQTRNGRRRWAGLRHYTSGAVIH